MRVNAAKQKLNKNEPVLIGFLGINDSVMAETIAMTGIDILIIDNEHMAFDDKDIMNVARAITSRGASCILRTAVKDVRTLSRYMELGIDGFSATQVSTVEDAKAIIDATKYPPLGQRGLCNFSRGYNCGFLEDMSIGEYMEHANDNTIITVTLENMEAINNAEAISKLDGIDVVHVGPNDLSASLGFQGDLTVPELGEIIKKAKETIIKANGKTSFSIPSPEKLPELVAQGQDVFLVGTDLNMIRGAFLRYTEALKK